MICFVLISVSTLFAAQWLIARKTSGDANNVNPPATSESCGCHFTTSTTYTGSAQKPTLTDEGKAIYGNDPLTLVYVSEDYNENIGVSSNINSMIHAGKYVCTITDAQTGQVICQNHEFTIDKAKVTITDTLSMSHIIPQLDGASVESDNITWVVMSKGTSTTVTVTADFVAHSNTDIAHTQTVTFEVTDEMVASKVYNSTSDSAKTLARNNFTFASTSDTFKVLPQAYTELSGTKTYYGNITDAMTADASKTSGTVIYPMQSVSYDYKSGESTLTKTYNVTAGKAGDYTHTLTKNCTIQSGVTLAIPVSGLSTSIVAATQTTALQMAAENYYDKANANASNTSSSTVAYDDADKKYEKNTLFIGAGIKLTNNGTIMLPALVSGGSGGGKVNSMVCGDYARIALEAGATIDNANNNSTIYCFGFIDKGETGNDASQVIVTKGSLYSVFTVSEHRGGSIYMGMANPTQDGLLSGLYAPDAPLVGSLYSNPYAVYNANVTVFPFNRFYIQSVCAPTVVKYGANVYGHAALEADGATNIANINLIGTNSANLIQLMATNSRVECRFTNFDWDSYVPATEGAKPTVAEIESVKQMQIDVYGNTSINPIALSLSVTKTAAGIVATVNVSLSSKNTLFPISHHLDIHFKPATVGGTSNVTLTGQSIKILPGASLTIDPGVTVNADKIAVYADTTLLNSYDNTTATGVAQGLAYPQKDSGELIVNGTLNVATLGGEVRTNSSTGKLFVTSGTSLSSDELVATTAASIDLLSLVTVSYKASTYGTVTLTANGVVATSPTDSASQTLATTATVPHYFSDNHQNGTVWYKSNISVTLNSTLGAFDDGTTQKVIQNLTTSANGIVDLQAIQAITPKHSDIRYAFMGWTTEQNGTTEMDLQEIAQAVRFSDVTLYAVWDQVPYITIAYKGNTTSATDVLFGEASSKLIGGSFTVLSSAGSAYCNNFEYSQYVTGWTLSSLVVDGTELVTTGSTPVTYSNTIGAVTTAKLLTDAGYTGDASTIENCSAIFAPVWTNKHIISFTINSGTYASTSIKVTVGSQSVTWTTQNGTEQMRYAKPTDEVTLVATAQGAQSDLGTFKTPDANGTTITVTGAYSITQKYHNKCNRSGSIFSGYTYTWETTYAGNYNEVNTVSPESFKPQDVTATETTITISSVNRGNTYD